MAVHKSLVKSPQNGSCKGHIPKVSKLARQASASGCSLCPAGSSPPQVAHSLTSCKLLLGCLLRDLPRPPSLKVPNSPNMTFLNLLSCSLFSSSLVTLSHTVIIYFFVKVVFCFPSLEHKLHEGRDFIYYISYELRIVPDTVDVQ